MHTAMVMHAENVHGRSGVHRAVRSWEDARQMGEITTGRDEESGE